MLSKFKTAIVLVIIGAFSGFLILGTNELTKDEIATAAFQREITAYKEIFDVDSIDEDDLGVTELDGLLAKEVVVKSANGTVIGYVYQGFDTNNYGDVEVLIGVNLDGTIAKVIIQSTSNTVTFVKTIKDNHLTPFEGQDASDVNYDARTGATYTYTSVSDIVAASAAYYEANRGDNNE